MLELVLPRVPGRWELHLSLTLRADGSVDRERVQGVHGCVIDRP